LAINHYDSLIIDWYYLLLKCPVLLDHYTGILDEEKEFVFDHEIFIEEKPSFYSFSNKTNEMTGKEFLPC
jgi:hypothetical protein